jgi:hypothetical protein
MKAKRRKVVRPEDVINSLELIVKTLKGLLKSMDPVDEKIWKEQGYSFWGRSLDLEDLKKEATKAKSRMVPKKSA